MITTEVKYTIDTTSHHGFVAYQAELKQPKPAVIICHDWTGRNALAEQKACQLAELGYVGFALDMYGSAKNGQTNQEKTALMMPMMEDRTLLSKRVNAALETVKALPQVDAERVFVIGYCFGGLCALDLARSGADVKGVVSFHGLLNAPATQQCKRMKAKVLVLHGYDDPMVPPQMLGQFADEMNQAGVDWQLHAYGKTLHAFTNPLAADYQLGTVYDKRADQRSWQTMLNFISE